MAKSIEDTLSAIPFHDSKLLDATLDPTQSPRTEGSRTTYALWSAEAWEAWNSQKKAGKTKLDLENQYPELKKLKELWDAQPPGPPKKKARRSSSPRQKGRPSTRLQYEEERNPREDKTRRSPSRRPSRRSRSRSRSRERPRYSRRSPSPPRKPTGGSWREAYGSPYRPRGNGQPAPDADFKNVRFAGYGARARRSRSRSPRSPTPDKRGQDRFERCDLKSMKPSLFDGKKLSAAWAQKTGATVNGLCYHGRLFEGPCQKKNCPSENSHKDAKLLPADTRLAIFNSVPLRR